MKKTVIIILAVLPIVMVIAIAFAGRIFSYYRYIPIEKVCFTDTYGNELDDKFTLTVNVGESKLANTRVFPDLASNKRVTFSSGDESICTVNQDGSVTGVSIGSTVVIVKTEDGETVTYRKPAAKKATNSGEFNLDDFFGDGMIK